MQMEAKRERRKQCEKEGKRNSEAATHFSPRTHANTLQGRTHESSAQTRSPTRNQNVRETPQHTTVPRKRRGRRGTIWLRLGDVALGRIEFERLAHAFVDPAIPDNTHHNRQGPKTSNSDSHKGNCSLHERNRHRWNDLQRRPTTMRTAVSTQDACYETRRQGSKRTNDSRNREEQERGEGGGGLEHTLSQHGTMPLYRPMIPSVFTICVTQSIMPV